MPWLGSKVEPPPLEAGPYTYILWLAREDFGFRHATLDDAVDQDLTIIGDDGDDFVLAISDRYGDWVRYWPWERFVCFNEGIPISAPFAAIWELLRLPWRGSAWPTKPTLERLTLGHIAAVIEKGEWIDP